MSGQSARINMIKQQLRTGDVLDDHILSLYEIIARDFFVPDGFKEFAYSDMQIQIKHNERMMTPLEEAKILQALALQGSETILEVGTGTGFFTALLSQLCKKVISIDCYMDFTQEAEKKLNALGIKNVELITGDACKGWVDKAPYDVMVFTGAIEHLTETERLQLIQRGKLFAILGKKPVMQGILFTSNNNHMDSEILFETNLPLLIDKNKKKEFVF